MRGPSFRPTDKRQNMQISASRDIGIEETSQTDIRDQDDSDAKIKIDVSLEGLTPSTPNTENSMLFHPVSVDDILANKFGTPLDGNSSDPSKHNQRTISGYSQNPVC